MTEGQVLDVAKKAIYTIIICSAPMLIISLVVGLIVSIFQTVTSIQEQTLTFVPKIICCICRTDDFWIMDFDKSDRIHDDIMVRILVCISVRTIYVRIYVFIG